MSARGSILRVSALAALLATTIAPSASAEGVRLKWDACGSEGVISKYFACDTNTGAGFSLYCSFFAPSGTTAVTGAEVIVDLLACSVMPDWWQYKNSGACRRTALSASADFTGMESAACSDFWLGQAAGGLAAYSTWLDGSIGHGRIILMYARAMQYADSLEAGREYAVARLTISRAATLGAGSCGGCTTPVRIFLNEVKLTQPLGVGDFRLSEAYGTDSFAEWQTGRNINFFCGDPVRNTTWGAIKAQYR